MRYFILIGFLLGLASCGADDAKDLTDFEVKGAQLFMSGDINAHTQIEFEEILADHPEITTLVQIDVPGSLDDAAMIALAYRVRDLGLNTHLTSESAIYSGGVDLFLAGVTRTIERGAVLGVHSWSDGEKDAAEYPRDHPAHAENRQYIVDMLGDDAFYWFTIYAAPFDGIHEMTPAEIDRYGLITPR